MEGVTEYKIGASSKLESLDRNDSFYTYGFDNCIVWKVETYATHNTIYT